MKSGRVPGFHGGSEYSVTPVGLPGIACTSLERHIAVIGEGVGRWP